MPPKPQLSAKQVPAPPLPPPTEDQLTLVREYASQLHYAYLARPSPSGPNRKGWEKHFAGDLGRMLGILDIAKFKYLPSFVIGCIFENNRRLRAKEKDFDPERVVDATTPGHPAYQKSSQSRLKYLPAFHGPYSLLSEDKLRNVWWNGPYDSDDDDEEQGLENESRKGHRDERKDAEADGDVIVGEGAEGESQADSTAGGVEDADGEEDKSQLPSIETKALPPTLRGRRPPSTTAGTTAAIERPTTRSLSHARGHAKADAPTLPPKTVAQKPSTSSTAPTKVPAPSSKAKGKRKAGTSGRGTLMLPDIMPETIALREVKHPRPCERCITLGITCMYNPLLRSGCSPCDNRKVSCSYAFKDKSNHVLATYLGYAFYRMITSPAVFAEPNFSPSQWPDPLPDKADYAWFRQQYRAVPRGRSEASKAQLAALMAAAERSPPSQHALAGAEELAEVSSLDAAPPVRPLRRYGRTSGTSTPTTRRSRSTSCGRSMKTSTSRASSAAPVEALPASPALSTMASQLSMETPTSRASSAAPVDESPASPSSSTMASHDGYSNAAGEHDNRLPNPPSSAATSHESEAGASTHAIEAADERAAPTDVEQVGTLVKVVGDDAMDTEPDFVDDEPFVISLPHNIDPIHASKVQDELSRRGSTRRPPADLPPPPAGAAKPSKKALTVPSINGNTIHPFPWDRYVLTAVIAESWRNLPRLGRRLADGTYCLVFPPHHLAEAHDILKELQNIGRDGLDVVDSLDASRAPAQSRPQTPDRQVFTINDNVVRLAQETKAKFDDMRQLERQLGDNVSIIRQHAREFVDGYRHAQEEVRAAADAEVEPENIAEPDMILTTAVHDTFLAIAQIHEIIRRLASVFPNIPAAPLNWPALLDLLSRVEDLRELYRAAWERFAALEEDVRPVRSNVLRIRQDVAQIQSQLDGIASEMMNVCRPLLNALHDRLSASIASLDARVSRMEGSTPSPLHPAPASIGDFLKVVTVVSERVDNLEQKVLERMDKLERKVETNLSSRVENEIAQYFANVGLREDILRQLGRDWSEPPRPGPIGGSISSQFPTVEDPPTTGGSIAEPPDSAPRMKTPLDRMDAATNTAPAANASAPPLRQQRSATVRRTTTSSSGRQ